MRARRKFYLILVLNIYLTIQVLTSNDIKNNLIITHRIEESKTIKNNKININIIDDENDINDTNINSTTNDYDQYPDNSYYYDIYEESDPEESQNKDDETFESLLDNEEFENNNKFNISQNSSESLEQIYEDYIFSGAKDYLDPNITKEEIQFNDISTLEVNSLSNQKI